MANETQNYATLMPLTWAGGRQCLLLFKASTSDSNLPQTG